VPDTISHLPDKHLICDGDLQILRLL